MPTSLQDTFERLETEWKEFRENNDDHTDNQNELDAALAEISVQRIKELAVLAIVFR
ncbi:MULTISPECIES: hypothetical protein [unclassified Rhizobium]|uniref:hypothetical protein n=1 Tax=unclassified Rhizobium TaxID=2613769 RepID=UPI001ADAB3B2|nr:MULTISPECIES: hypothetical protein [unclassified Rhizobium]MBO9099395.1 hypothetical protein [Rhizobium sp. L58/93]QXZ87115.1 hypothetical protein J5287_21270 [Rhizobium sp. K1/93]QXZ92851.1 hypothetical protein J5280_19625 [Rhizobium sp. K15/93]